MLILLVTLAFVALLKRYTIDNSVSFCYIMDEAKK